MSTFTTAQSAQLQTWISENRDDDSFVETLIVWVNDNTKKIRSKSPAKDVDPDRVKRPVPASWMYREDKREEIIRDYFEGEAVKGSLVAKKAQELWKELSADEKFPYEEKRKELWEEYKRSTPNVERKEKVTFVVKVDEEREVPEGWDGPYEDTYLHKYVKGLGKKVGFGRFETFASAVEAASKLDNCGGITMGKSGYTLREGCDPLSVEGDTKDGPFTSWTKSGFVSSKSVKKDKKSGKKSGKKDKKSGKKEKKSGKKLKVSADKLDAEKLDAEKLEADKLEADKLEAEKLEADKLEADKLEDEVSDSDEEEDEVSDSDEDQTEVEHWEHKGVTYLLDEDTNDVYDEETSSLLGKRTKVSGGWEVNFD